MLEIVCVCSLPPPGNRLNTVSGQACPVVAQRQPFAPLPPLPATSHRRPSATSPGVPDCRRVRQHSRIASHSAHTAQPTSSDLLPSQGRNRRFLRFTLSLRGRCEVRHTRRGLLHRHLRDARGRWGATLRGGRPGHLACAGFFSFFLSPLGPCPRPFASRLTADMRARRNRLTPRVHGSTGFCAV
jgi:hypothetical protein